MSFFPPAVTKKNEFYVFSYFNSVDLFFIQILLKPVSGQTLLPESRIC